jgi:hypothetical protein
MPLVAPVMTAFVNMLMAQLPQTSDSEKYVKKALTLSSYLL